MSQNEKEKELINKIAFTLWKSTVNGSKANIEVRWDSIKDDSVCEKYYDNAKDIIKLINKG